jgi:FkbM family methyltransferase
MLEAVPAHDYWLDLGARMPPALRTRSSLRLLSALARRQKTGDELVTTNLGISQSLKIQVRPAHLHARFGKPSLYDGERGALELACLFSRSADAFVDVGAHLGFFTFAVRKLGSPSVPIYFFEPDPDLFRLLKANVAANQLQGVVGLKAAIGSENQTATFFANRSDSSSGSLTSTFAERHDTHPIDVQVRSFASVAAEYGMSKACVKVDVENAEWEFLEGALGGFDRIAALIIEILGPAHAADFVPAVMARTNMHAYYINDYVLEHSIDGSFVYREPQYNWLFCREDPEHLAIRLRPTPLSVRT